MFLKHWFRFLLAIVLCFSICTIATGIRQAEAKDMFIKLADTGRLSLGKDQKWEQEFRANDGDVKIRFRTLRFGSDRKRNHIIIWWRDHGGKYQRVADGYCPKNSQGYAFQVYQDLNTKRVFFVFDAGGRLAVYGYDTLASKLERYIDSVNFYSKEPYPEIDATSDGSLQLKFDNYLGNSSMPYKYQLFWDEKANWFGWRDVTDYHAEEERHYTPGRNTSYSSDVSEDEQLYYEEEVVQQ